MFSDLGYYIGEYNIIILSQAVERKGKTTKMKPSLSTFSFQAFAVC